MCNTMSTLSGMTNNDILSCRWFLTAGWEHCHRATTNSTLVHCRLRCVLTLLWRCLENNHNSQAKLPCWASIIFFGILMLLDNEITLLKIYHANVVLINQNDNKQWKMKTPKTQINKLHSIIHSLVICPLSRFMTVSTYCSPDAPIFSCFLQICIILSF